MREQENSSFSLYPQLVTKVMGILNEHEAAFGRTHERCGCV